MPDMDFTSFKDVEFTPDGYMLNPNDWTPEIAVAIAEILGIFLSDKHWEIINFSREVYFKEEKSVSMRRVMDDLGTPYQEIFDLFPELPPRTIAKIAGLPKPVGCM
jgi:TusE/DsrC/DsvC family sulfur relay protein